METGARSPDAALELGRLLWRCRRGMRELEALLERFAREEYVQAPGAQRRAFELLLELPDPAIAAYLLGTDRPAEPALAALTDRLAHRSADTS